MRAFRVSRLGGPISCCVLPLIIVWWSAAAEGETVGEDPAFDRYTISRPKVEVAGLFGSNKRRIGDYATVRRKVGITSGYATKFTLDITTSENLKLHVEGKLHHEDAEDVTETSLGDALEEELLGTSDIGPLTPFWEQLTASMLEGKQPGEKWTLDVRREYFPEQPLYPSGLITNGERRILIEARCNEPDTVDNLLEIWEDGVLLGHWSSTRENDYFLRADLSPQLKALVIAALEVFAINHIQGPHRFPLWGPY